LGVGVGSGPPGLPGAGKPGSEGGVCACARNPANRTQLVPINTVFIVYPRIFMLMGSSKQRTSFVLASGLLSVLGTT